MDRSYEVTDSSDWLNTPIAPLGSVEVALRCQVCKDFYNTPMITSCSHTFCSLCIRRCLTNDGKCPSCRTSDQELRLRRNWAVEELVDAFQAARPSIIKLGQELVSARTGGDIKSHKRKLDDADLREPKQFTASQRKTRSRSQRSPLRDVEYDGSPAVSQEDIGDTEPDDGLSACPICNRRMKEEDVFPHLDTHQGDDSETQTRRIQHTWASVPKLSSRSATPKPPDRLPSLSYSIMNENTLKKKITSLGIPSWGPKQLLIRRHTEWVNLWNANCDSSRPRTKRELLSDLDSWERTQGGLAPNASNSQAGPSSIMRKDFDGAAWAANHDDDFRQLTAKARQKRSTGAMVGSSGSNERLDRSPHRNTDPVSSTGDWSAPRIEETRASAKFKKDASPIVYPLRQAVIDLDGNDDLK